MLISRLFTGRSGSYLVATYSQVLGAHYYTISGQGIVPPRFRQYLENGASERNSKTGLRHRMGNLLWGPTPHA